MKNESKLIFGFLALFAFICMGAQQIVTNDPSDPSGRTKTSSLVLTNGLIATTNAVPPHAVQGVTTSAGAADSGKIPKLNASGKVDGSMLSASVTISLISTNHVGSLSGSGSAHTWADLISFASTSSTGTVSGVAIASHDTTAISFVRVKKNSNSKILGQIGPINPVASGFTATVPFKDFLTGSTETYVLQVSSDAGGISWKDNYDLAGGPTVTNGLSIYLEQSTPQ